jgi:hypothetical protein
MAILLAIPPNALSQQPAQTPPAEGKPVSSLPTVQNLKVIVLAGNGEVNDLERRVMAPLVVEILDLQDRPIEGADVVFRFPLRGPSAVFADQKSAKTVRSNGQGEAAATGWTANNELGTFQVHVTATYGNQVGETTITMSNVARSRDAQMSKIGGRKSLWSSKWFKIGLIAGGAGLAAGIVLATRGGGGATNRTITVTPGSPSVGGPP